MFADTDRWRLFTRDDMAARLVRTCSVEWFLRAYRVPTRCKGRVIAGADLLKALADPPPPESEPGDWQAPGDAAPEQDREQAPEPVGRPTAAEHRRPRGDFRGPAVGPPRLTAGGTPRQAAGPTLCRDIQPLTKGGRPA